MKKSRSRPASAVCAAALVWLLSAPETGVPRRVASPPSAAEAEGDGWTAARPGYAWSFPADHGTHPGYRSEWWYFVGQLRDAGAPERDFGYQLTFFRIGVAPQAPPLDSAWSASDLVMAHAAITDIGRGTHRFEEALHRAIPLLGGFGAPPDPRIAWTLPPAGATEPWTLRWTGGGFELAMGDEAGDMALRLDTRATRGPVFEGPGGLSRKAEAPGAASLYYSFTRLPTSGTLWLAGERVEVAGSSWMDHEISSQQLAPGQVGWDWFGLQLDDGRDLMLYRLRRADGTTDFSRGTLIPAGGEPRYLDPTAWSLTATGSWTSPASGVEYPSGWRLRLPGEGLDLRVEPRVADQENRGRIVYWEGAVGVRDAGGAPAGRGYVELTGYGAGNRPAL